MKFAEWIKELKEKYGIENPAFTTGSGLSRLYDAFMEIENREEIMFLIKRKSGTVRESCHGVKTKRGNRIYVDCPSVGSVCLLDDIQQLIISFANVSIEGSHPYTYKMESYD